MDFGGALDSVGVDEGASEADDDFATPGHVEAPAVGDFGNLNAFEIFFVGLGDELVHIGGVNDDGHTFLRFGDGEFGAIEALVFLGDDVEVDVEAVGELANGDRDSASAEVVAAFDFVGKLGICLLYTSPSPRD